MSTDGLDMTDIDKPVTILLIEILHHHIQCVIIPIIMCYTLRYTWLPIYTEAIQCIHHLTTVVVYKYILTNLPITANDLTTDY